MKITILGANGQTGVQVIKQALEAGYTVNALVRNAETLKKRADLNLFVGNATNVKDVSAASKGSDVIISVLGTDPSKTSTLMSDAVSAVIEASKSTGVKRFIFMSSFGVSSHLAGGAMKSVSWMMKRMFKDYVVGAAILRNSNLDWTVVHAARLTNQPKGSGLRVIPSTEKLSIKHQITRADVATWILQETKENAYIKAEVTISR